VGGSTWWWQGGGRVCEPRAAHVRKKGQRRSSSSTPGVMGCAREAAVCCGVDEMPPTPKSYEVELVETSGCLQVQRLVLG
jgi:hypothetical protein